MTQSLIEKTLFSPIDKNKKDTSDSIPTCTTAAKKYYIKLITSFYVKLKLIETGFQHSFLSHVALKHWLSFSSTTLGVV